VIIVLAAHSVRVRRDKRTDAVRALSRLHRQVQRQREQSERLPVAIGHGKGRRPAVRLRRQRLALGHVLHELFCAETHERSLVEQKVRTSAVACPGTVDGRECIIIVYGIKSPRYSSVTDLQLPVLITIMTVDSDRSYR